ncbi:MAG: endo alpha-1,4 polygalactosaminidase [Candidatus Aminicenantes bacterium]|nr:endo alpha-1,4 polygalactosaminidase [Candidatus Aminicenantes bacterium]
MGLQNIKKLLVLSFLIFVLVFSGKCSGDSDTYIQNENPDPLEPLVISSWGYQLQDADPVEISTSSLDLVVFDYSRTGEEDGKYTPEEISGIKNRDVIPIAYISIGEAEDYRFYWEEGWNKNPPEWLGKENPDWEGNYEVKYWIDEWKEIIFIYLDKILDQGFSGVYLDIVDGFEYWSDDEIKKSEDLTEEEAALRMIIFIKEISEYCREKAGDGFLIIPQNGENIIDYDIADEFINSISGIGIEDLFFDGIEPVSEVEINYRIVFIERIKGSDKYVFSIDYVDDGSGYSGKNKERIDKYYKYCGDYNYFPYPGRSDRELDELNIISDLNSGSEF